MTGKITTILAKREAETYCLHGLHKEALHIYRRLLNTSPNIDDAFKAAIENQIKKISGALESDDLDEANRLTASDIARVKEGWGETATESDRLICAQAFYQVGYYKEALNELAAMVENGCDAERITALLADCLTQLYDPSQIVKAIERFTLENVNQPAGRPHLCLVLAEEMAASDQPQHAAAIVDDLQTHSATGELDAQRLSAISDRIGSLSAAQTTTETRHPAPGSKKSSPAGHGTRDDDPNPPTAPGSSSGFFSRRFFFFRKKSQRSGSRS